MAKKKGDGRQQEAEASGNQVAEVEFDVLCEAANDAARAITRAAGDRSIPPWSHTRPEEKGAARQRMRSFLDDPDSNPGTGTANRVYHAIAAAFPMPVEF